jgi:hypothetical protein
MNLDLTFASIQKITSFLNYFQPISIYRRKWFKIVFHPSGRSTFALDYICVDYVDAEKRSFATQRRVVSQTTRKKGGNKGIRTLGLCLAKAPLYQLSYIPFFCKPLFVSHCLCTCVDVVIHPSIRPSIHKVEKRKSGEAEKLRSGEVEKRRSGEAEKWTGLCPGTRQSRPQSGAVSFATQRRTTTSSALLSTTSTQGDYVKAEKDGGKKSWTILNLNQ